MPKSKPIVLVVEDDLELLDALTTTLEVNGYDYIGVDGAAEAMRALEQKSVDLVISDINMPGRNGFELLQDLRTAQPGLPVILMTAYGQVTQAVAAMQQGARDYLVKPFTNEQLLESVERWLGNRAGNAKGAAEPIAVDSASRRVFQLAKRVAITDSTVLISGESGTGKEVLARYVHQHSNRHKGPFIAINCAAIPENMLEAMLFGHEKGAFTGATATSPGKFEQADGGTLLLDEISEMDLGLQAKLLRVLQEREVERIGGRKTIPLDVRVIATTNRDLQGRVAEGQFREDLYYRLSVFPLQWQPLRERAADILPLARHLLLQHAGRMGLGKMEFDASACQALTQHSWPGNVRELDNAVQRALILSQGHLVTAADLSLQGMDTDCGSARMVMATAPDGGDDATETSELEDNGVLGQEMRMREFQIILDALRLERGRRNRVAEKLGISPRTLRYKIARMRECGIDVENTLMTAS